MKCIPGECPHCAAWATIPGKARCERRGKPGASWASRDDTGPWFSVCIGQSCIDDWRRARGQVVGQESLFDDPLEDDDE